MIIRSRSNPGNSPVMIKNVTYIDLPINWYYNFYKRPPNLHCTRDHVPDTVKPLACFIVRLSQISPALHWPKWKRCLLSSVNKLQQTLGQWWSIQQPPRHVCAGLYLPASRADSALLGPRRDCTFAKHFRTQFPEGGTDHCGFRTGLNVSETPTLPLLRLYVVHC
jgi:hypothetical protein